MRNRAPRFQGPNAITKDHNRPKDKTDRDHAADKDQQVKRIDIAKQLDDHVVYGKKRHGADGRKRSCQPDTTDFSL